MSEPAHLQDNSLHVRSNALDGFDVRGHGLPSIESSLLLQSRTELQPTTASKEFSEVRHRSFARVSANGKVTFLK